MLYLLTPTKQWHQIDADVEITCIYCNRSCPASISSRCSELSRRPGALGSGPQSWSRDAWHHSLWPITAVLYKWPKRITISCKIITKSNKNAAKRAWRLRQKCYEKLRMYYLALRETPACGTGTRHYFPYQNTSSFARQLPTLLYTYRNLKMAKL